MIELAIRIVLLVVMAVGLILVVTEIAVVSLRVVLLSTAVLFLLMLCACSTTPRVQYVGTSFSMPVKPDADFQCQDEPSVAGITTDEQDADYKLSLRRAWIDCRDRLHAAGSVWRSTEQALEASKAKPK